jgi:hypothetical protein
MSDQVEAAIAAAMTKLGAPYVWATAGPDTFDCSGFTWWVASQVLGPLDYELRSSHHQFNVWGDPVTWSEIVAGDLVFFDTMGVVVMGNRGSHVGMMSDGERFIHAANEDLGVRIDRLDADWYMPKFIGARRIFETAPIDDGEPGALGWDRAHLPNIDTGREVRTPTPWNGVRFGVTWQSVYAWREEIERSAREEDVAAAHLAVLMMVETQGVHERNGVVIEVWDNHPEDGPSVGLMQVKPWVWSRLRPELNAYVPADNIRLGAAVLASLIEKHGDFSSAVAEGYHPGTAPNGTTGTSYVEAARGLLRELGYAS